MYSDGANVPILTLYVKIKVYGGTANCLVFASSTVHLCSLDFEVYYFFNPFYFKRDLSAFVVEQAWVNLSQVSLPEVLPACLLRAWPTRQGLSKN